MSDTCYPQRNPYIVSIHPQANFSTDPHGEVDLYTDGLFQQAKDKVRQVKDTVKGARDSVRKAYEKSGMSWISSAQQDWDKFIALMPDPKTQSNLSQKQQRLNTFERYESLNEIDRSTKLWLDPKQDPRTLTDREEKFLTDNIEKLNEEQIEWLKRVLPKMKENWEQMYRDHYLPKRNTGWESQSAGDRREYYSWMRVNYPKTIDFILQILTAPQSHPK